MELQTLQEALKVEIQVHQKLVAQMKQDPQNADLKKQLHELQAKITALSEKQCPDVEGIERIPLHKPKEKQSLFVDKAENSQYQDLLRCMAADLKLPVEDVQDSQNQFLDTFSLLALLSLSTKPSCNQVKWTGIHQLPTPKRADCRYFMPSKAKKLDLLGLKVCSSAGIQFLTANYQTILPKASRPFSEVVCSSTSHHPVPSVYMEEEPELEPQVPIVPTRACSSSLDDIVNPSSPSPLNEYYQNQELLQRVANDLQIPLEKIKDLQRWLLDILQPQ
ncbi:hypothetical protein KIL84_007438 [Mauremys mutica]|uniref:Uncharacterized protein n=1 Tax=Mauremys mutica TaxID=74926 RepID=A0A9D3X332_9SAUR|nr:hypothetical protein KIL84_007438 [Mauremys mutica]